MGRVSRGIHAAKPTRHATRPQRTRPFKKENDSALPGSPCSRLDSLTISGWIRESARLRLGDRAPHEGAELLEERCILALDDVHLTKDRPNVQVNRRRLLVSRIRPLRDDLIVDE